MKKLYLILAITGYFLGSVLCFAAQDFIDETTFKRVFFDGHSYIIAGSVGMCHDPDCGCEKHWISVYDEQYKVWHHHKEPIGPPD